MRAEITLALIALPVGLLVGSGVKTLAHRLPRSDVSLLAPAACPKCGRTLDLRQRMPLLGYFLGKELCSGCAGGLPRSRPWVEALTALALVAAALRFGVAAATPIAMLFCAVLILLGAIDREHFILPDVVTLPALIVGLVAQPWIPWTSLRSAVFGALLGAAVLLVINQVGWLVRGSQGLGLGDVKMLAMIGAWLGIGGMVISLTVAAVAGSLVALLGGGPRDAASRWPFGVFLALGGVFALFLTTPLLRWYLTGSL